MKKQNLSLWLERNDVGRIEFIVYCIAGVFAAIWLGAWVWHSWTELAIYLLKNGVI